MRFLRRRSGRPAPGRSAQGSTLQAMELERRELLTSVPSVNQLFNQYVPSDLKILNPITHQPLPYSVQHHVSINPTVSNPLVGNEGKIVAGTDRQGDKWTITVHGPGEVIVTDTSPNDGSLDDSIATIQLVGTNINKTYVTGTVIGSNEVQTDSTVEFNTLEDVSGVRSIMLNGFSLGETVAPATGTPNNTSTGIFLLGGVRTLQFNNIIAIVDTSTNDVPVNIIIGDPNNPLQVKPSIKLNSIFNTQFDSTATTVPALVPVTTPTVNIIVNGAIKNLNFISTTQDTVQASSQFEFPTVATTGRTSVQATSLGNLTVHGAATNLTASRSSVPFQSGFSSLASLNKATFQGPTDAVGLDVNGTIGSLTFAKGIGNTTNTFLGTTTGGDVPATGYGRPADQTSYAGAGLISGQVTAKKIGRLTILPSSVSTVPLEDPTFATKTVAVNGNAATNALIASATNIGHTVIQGNLQNTEIKAGFHYNSFAAGLEGTRAPSKIGKLKQTGDNISAVVSSTVRPGVNNVYGAPFTVHGPGKITGKQTGSNTNTGSLTPLGNSGAGYFARKKV